MEDRPAHLKSRSSSWRTTTVCLSMLFIAAGRRGFLPCETTLDPLARAGL